MLWRRNQSNQYVCICLGRPWAHAQDHGEGNTSDVPQQTILCLICLCQKCTTHEYPTACTGQSRMPSCTPAQSYRKRSTFDTWRTLTLSMLAQTANGWGTKARSLVFDMMDVAYFERTSRLLLQRHQESRHIIEERIFRNNLNIEAPYLWRG